MSPCAQMHLHFAAASTVFGRSRKLRTYLLILTPACSFDLSTSTLFKNRMKSTLANNLFAQTSFHRSRLSSYTTNLISRDQVEPVYTPTSLFTDRSSASFWSKAPMGARNMIAWQSSKNCIHVCRWVLDYTTR
jgi:hypothetical protein